MALIKCNECGRKISDKASACPKCGAPVSVESTHADSDVKDNANSRKSYLLKLFIALDILAVILVGGYLLSKVILINPADYDENDIENNISDTTEPTSPILQAFIITEPTAEQIIAIESTDTAESITDYDENNTGDTAEKDITEPETTQLPINLPVLKEGDKSDDVRDLQIKLRDIGLYDGDIDGSFGLRTKNAIIKLQEMYNIIPSGMVNTETWVAIDNALHLITIDKSQTDVQSYEDNITDTDDIDEKDTQEYDANTSVESIGLNGLEITFQFGNDIILDKIKDNSSKNNGKEIFQLPVIVKNLKSDPDKLSRMNITQFGVSGKLDDISNYVDDIRHTNIGGGESVNGYIFFLYEGKGTYSIEFESNEKKHKVDFLIGYDEGEASDYILTLD